MKTKTKIILILAISILTLNGVSNPKYLFPRINEIYFDNNNKWFIELDFGFFSQMYGILDSIYITTSNYSARIVKNKTLSYYDGYEVHTWDSVPFEPKLPYFTQDSLNKNLFIDRAGDSICIKFYYKQQSRDDTTLYYNRINSASFVWGSKVNVSGYYRCPYSPKKGQSIQKIYNYNPYYSLSNVPSLGKENDTTGAMSNLCIKVYTPENLLISKPYFINDFIDSRTYSINGNFCLRCPNFIDSCKGIYIGNDYYFRVYYLVTPSIIKTQIDSTTNVSLYLTEPFDLSVNDNNNKENSISIISSPNPFNNETTFYYNIPEGINYKKAIINISNVQGVKLKQIELKDKKNAVKWNAEALSSGLYFYQLIIDDNIIKIGNLIITK